MNSRSVSVLTLQPSGLENETSAEGKRKADSPHSKRAQWAQELTSGPERKRKDKGKEMVRNQSKTHLEKGSEGLCQKPSHRC